MPKGEDAEKMASGEMSTQEYETKRLNDRSIVMDASPQVKTSLALDGLAAWPCQPRNGLVKAVICGLGFTMAEKEVMAMGQKGFVHSNLKQVLMYIAGSTRHRGEWGALGDHA